MLYTFQLTRYLLNAMQGVLKAVFEKVKNSSQMLQQVTEYIAWTYFS